eukprot:TRINITY_DN3415_c0_g1_i1.p1 TRINITY_DN3415_c0_g1~~TRINITY_DN3415_c0_g1_i1.p1  ORF type:complete len:558 (-),score=71.39 TRINITY_DN3415_c0_g1_i1:33-1469(-)
MGAIDTTAAGDHGSAVTSIYKPGIEYNGRFRYPQIILATIIKFCANTASRFVYPFSPFLSEDLGVSVAAYNGALAAGEAITLTATFVGPLGDFLGKRDIMIAGGITMIVGLSVMGIAPSLAMLYVSRMLFMTGFSLFFPTMQSYLGMYVPVATRGRVTGLIESAWALSGLLGLFLMGLLIDAGGIRWPFIALASALFLALVFIPWILYNDKQDRHDAAGSATSIWTVFVTLFSVWKSVLSKRVSYLVMLMGFMQSFAGTLVFASYGLWLERDHDKDVSFVGQTTIGLGAAEFVGAMTVTFVSDKLGLKRSVGGSLALLSLAYFALAASANILPLGLAVSFTSFGLYEVALISSIAIVSEVIPAHRNVITTLYLAALAISRLAGALLVEPLWHARGMVAIGCVGGAAVVVAFVASVLIKYQPPSVAADIESSVSLDQESDDVYSTDDDDDDDVYTSVGSDSDSSSIDSNSATSASSGDT